MSTTARPDPRGPVSRAGICIDVTDTSTDEVRAFATSRDGPLHLERRADRTYLVAKPA